MNENHKKLKEIANHLGLNSILLTYRDWCGEMTDGTFKIFVRFKEYGLKKDCWSFSLGVDRQNLIYVSNEEKARSTLGINVSHLKSSEQMAKEIQRQLISNSKEYVEIVLDRLKSHDKYIKKIEENKKVVSKIINEEFMDKNDTTSFNIGFSTDEGYGSVQVGSDSMTIEIRSLPIDVGIEVLKFIKSRRKK